MRVGFILCCLAPFEVFTQGADGLAILPGDFTLHGPSARQLLIVQPIRGGEFAGQSSETAFLSSEDTNIVRIEKSTAWPIANGQTAIKATCGDQTESVQVRVVGMEKPAEVSFRNNVQPILAKAGCSSGACHGAAAGQNGFKLSLRGYDDEGDYLALTRHAQGRRIVPSDPGRSLMLLKPTGAVPHKGGTRFDVESVEYRILADWIAAGTPAPKPDDPRITRIEIFPPRVRLSPNTSQQLIVLAHFTDGRTEDVTRWAKYTDAKSAVTQADETGNVKVLGYGEGAVTAWYLSRIAIATVTAPYDNQVAPEVFTQAKRRNFIDELVLEKLRSLNLPPSPPVSDSEFLRRAHLDTIGVLPSAQTTRAFLANQAHNKRDELIESLLQRPEFVDYWTYKWSDLLLVNSERLRPAAMWSYYNWIRQNVALNTPWDVLVRRLVTAKGSTLENGAANFFVLHEDPPSMAETTTQAFLGMPINCARCHNHPMEKWTNDEYFGMVNLFARVRLKTGSTDGDRMVFVAASGDINQPLRGRPQPPKPLDGKPLPVQSTEDRREYLAEWLVSPSNPYFSRAVVNRIWANFFDVGLVDPVDDLRMTNPASNEKLLSAVAAFLAGRHFDIKALMRAILQSETYQRSSQPLPENGADTRFYPRYYPRRLMAEVLLDAISQVTEAPTKFPNYPETWRAIQLPDSNVDSYFLKSFGRPDRVKTCECERTEQPSMAQVLHIANGDTINKKLAAKGNRIDRLLAENPSPESVIEDAFLSALSRYPTESEKEKLLQVMKDADPKERRSLTEDVFWAILSSKEFLFNH